LTPDYKTLGSCLRLFGRLVTSPSATARALLAGACLALGATGCSTSPKNLLGVDLPWKRDQPSQELQLSWARVQEKNGNPTLAREAYQKVLKDDPKSVEAIMGVARLDQLAGRGEQAEQGFQRVIRLSPQSGQAWDALGEYYSSQERWQDAVQALTHAMQTAPDDKLFRYHLAVALARSGNIEGAMPHFAQAVGAAEAHYNIGRILYDMGNVKASEEQFVLAMMKNPQLEAAQIWLDEIRNEREPTIARTNAPANAGAVAQTRARVIHPLPVNQGQPGASNAGPTITPAAGAGVTPVSGVVEQPHSGYSPPDFAPAAAANPVQLNTIEQTPGGWSPAAPLQQGARPW
jgi:tetratricopeptide (TPR) repeat protein